MNYHKNDISQSEDDDNDVRELGTANISDWYRDFLNVGTDLLFDLVLVCWLFIKLFI
jgi:hypothetical protein